MSREEADRSHSEGFPRVLARNSRTEHIRQISSSSFELARPKLRQRTKETTVTLPPFSLPPRVFSFHPVALCSPLSHLPSSPPFSPFLLTFLAFFPSLPFFLTFFLSSHFSPFPPVLSFNFSLLSSFLSAFLSSFAAHVLPAGLSCWKSSSITSSAS